MSEVRTLGRIIFRTGPDWTGPDRTGPDQTRPDRTGPDRTGPDRTGPDRTGPDQTRPDQTGPYRTCVNPCEAMVNPTTNNYSCTSIIVYQLANIQLKFSGNLIEADRAGDILNRRSRSGMLVFMNSAPIYWLSKKQTTVETSSFCSESVAMKICCEYIRGPRYKLRMMGIPVSNPVFIYGDNQLVLWNTTIPDSNLKKKSN